VGKHEARHFWSGENCGHEIEMLVNPRIKAASTRSPHDHIREMQPLNGHLCRIKRASVRAKDLIERADAALDSRRVRDALEPR